MVRPLIPSPPTSPPSDPLPAFVPEPSATEAPLVFPAPPTVYAGIPSTFPIKISQITAEFGGNSLLTAAPAAGLSAPVSISSFAGMSANEGSGSFRSGYFVDWNAYGFCTVYTVFGTPYSPLFPNGEPVAAIWQGEGFPVAANRLTIYAFGTAPNDDAMFHSVTINGVKRYRADANYIPSAIHIWEWDDVPLGTIVNGVTYEPIWRTS